MSTVTEQIKQLKQALAKPDLPDYELPHITATTNRGHKLEPGADKVSSSFLDVRNRKDEAIAESSEESDLELDAEDINPSRILQPISDPAEVSSNPIIKQIFESKVPQVISNDLLKKLVTEKKILTNAKKLLAALLGDDDLYLADQVMHTPKPEPITDAMLEALKEEAISENPIEGTRSDSKNWPSAISASFDRSKFFSSPLPSMSSSGTDNTKLKENLQVLIQYYEEYISCLTQIRMGLTKTQRTRRRVLNWCRELNNEDYVKEDLDSQNGNDNAGLGEWMPKDKPEQSGV